MRIKNPAVAAKDTPYYFIVNRRRLPKFDAIGIKIVDENGHEGLITRSRDPRQLADLYGFIDAKRYDSNIYQISFAYIESAPQHGPLLYDLMMELVTLGECYLTSDLEISKDAKKIWNYYYHNRSDVTKKLLLEIDPFYKDIATRKLIWRESGPNPLLYGYQKFPSTLLTLEKRGRILLLPQK